MREVLDAQFTGRTDWWSVVCLGVYRTPLYAYKGILKIVSIFFIFHDLQTLFILKSKGVYDPSPDTIQTQKNVIIV